MNRREDIFGVRSLRHWTIIWGVAMVASSTVIAFFDGFPWESIGIFLVIFTASQYGAYMSRYFMAKSRDERYQDYLRKKLLTPGYTISDFELSEFDEEHYPLLAEEVRQSLRRHQEP